MRSNHAARFSPGWLDNALAQIFWGTGGIVINLITKTLSATLLVGIRHGIGALVLVSSIVKGRGQALKDLPWKHAIILGIIAGAPPDLLVVESIRRSGPVVAVLLARLEIPLGVLFAHIFLKEKVTAKAYVASGLSLVGGCLISYQPGQALSLRNGFYIGVLAGVSSGILWGVAAVYGKFVLSRSSGALGVTFVRLALGSITSFIAAAFLGGRLFSALQHLRLSDWLWLLYLGVFVSGIGYLLFYRSLKLIDAHVAQVLMGLSIITLLLLGVVTGVHISLLQWSGVAVISWSIYLIKNRQAATD